MGEALVDLTSIDWQTHLDRLEVSGHSVVPSLLPSLACRELRESFERDELFRSTIVMEKHAYGRGVYRYFGSPLPDLVLELRAGLYEPLVPIANRWQEALGNQVRYPERFAQFQKRCHAAGQQRPTPLLLRYGPGDFNRLHQDLYGEHVFPIQVAILLTEPGRDFSGGEFVLTEQRARMQSRVEVVPLRRGDAVLFAGSMRPVRSVRGFARAQMRHGVSPIREGQRLTLGVIFHDAV